MTPEDIEHLAATLKTRSGLILGSDKTYLIESRLSPVARREGFANVSALLTALRTKRDEKLMAAVTDAMTTNETFSSATSCRSTSSRAISCRPWLRRASAATSRCGAPPVRPAKSPIRWPC
ncbi:hypothetical protein [Asticcacaulis taihuensis]|uniref:hypothetical protein n=1 Tax=Asticcacaulis taihuensis TaxID=260084 RepID=UPI003F7CA8F5